MANTPIRGYRELSAEEIQSINDIKVEGDTIAELITELQEKHPDLDPRWLAIGRTHLQQGMMELVRAIAKPQGF